MSPITSVRCQKCGEFYPVEIMQQGHNCPAEPRPIRGPAQPQLSRIDQSRPPVMRRRPTDSGTVERFYSGSAAAADFDGLTTFEEFRQMVRAPGLIEDVAVPFAKALITALLIWGLCSAVIYVIFDFFASLEGRQPPPLMLSIKIGGFIALVALVVAWILFLRVSDGSLANVERREIAPPPPAQPAPVALDPVELALRPVKLRIDRDNGADFIKLPFDTPTLRRVALSLKAGKPFTVNGMTGAGAPLSRAEYNSLRDAMLDHGFIAWKDAANRNQGVEFTAEGDALLDEIIAKTS